MPKATRGRIEVLIGTRPPRLRGAPNERLMAVGGAVIRMCRYLSRAVREIALSLYVG